MLENLFNKKKREREVISIFELVFNSNILTAF